MAIPRYACAIVILMLVSGCARQAPREPVRAVDFIREFDRADKRPPAGFQIADYAAGGVRHPSVIAPVPSRLTTALPVPRHGIFRAFVALAASPGEVSRGPVRFRVGVSDHRIYEALADIVVTPEDTGWAVLRADLSRYAGWQWSLFYRPDGVTWRVVLGADPVAGSGSRAAWGAPEIVTDSASAREYAVRRQRLR